MNKLAKFVNKCLTNKRWFNDGDFCNGKTHPSGLAYRRYRRGKTRCLECGAKFGQGVYKQQSFAERMIDSVYQPSPFLAWLKGRNQVMEG